jgi:hypothetical protein
MRMTSLIVGMTALAAMALAAAPSMASDRSIGNRDAAVLSHGSGGSEGILGGTMFERDALDLNLNTSYREGAGIGMVRMIIASNDVGLGVWSDNVYSSKIVGVHSGISLHGIGTLSGDIAMSNCARHGETVSPSMFSPMRFDDLSAPLGHSMAIGASGWSGTSAIPARACGGGSSWFQPDA